MVWGRTPRRWTERPHISTSTQVTCLRSRAIIRLVSDKVPVWLPVTSNVEPVANIAVFNTLGPAARMSDPSREFRAVSPTPQRIGDAGKPDFR